MPLIERPKVLSEVMIRKDQSVYGNVIVPTGAEINIGTLLISTDGGVTWNARTQSEWAEGSFADGAIVYYEGHIWESLVDANTAVPGTDPLKWQDNGIWEPNGMICEYADVSGEYEVMTSGYAVEKRITGFHEAMRPALFAKKISLK